MFSVANHHIIGEIYPEKSPRKKADIYPAKGGQKREITQKMQNGKSIKCAKITGSIIYIMDPDQ